MSAITTHVLDTAQGKPAAAILVILERRTHSAGWQKVGEGLTDIDGRITDLLPTTDLMVSGHYRLTFEVGPYFMLQDIDCFFPKISVDFTIKDAHQHHHVPLLLSPFGYTTYRGS
jgi:5-hydroxyisourate hydrolase